LFHCSEKDILHEEIYSLEVVKDKLRARIADLEEEVSMMREGFSNKSSDVTATNAEVRSVHMVYCFRHVYCIN